MRILDGLKGLKYYRMRMNLTQEQLADMLGVQRATVAMWETGRSWPSAALLPAMADLLLCSIDDLYRPHDDCTEEEEACPCQTATVIYTDVTAGLPV